MRPRVFPAEDVGLLRRAIVQPRGFNEAAGIPRGRLSVLRLRALLDALLQ